MKNKIKVGDRIEVEQAWEDPSGYSLDEIAKVMAIDENGNMTLKFIGSGSKKITDFLSGSEFNVKNYQDCIIEKEK